MSTTAVPRPEYPRPQFVRKDWLCLNGEWEFEIDNGDSGKERDLLERPLEGKITVPFCPESPLSGVGHVDFMRAVWYRRVITIPESWAGQGVLLHFGAIDYDATIWVNGIQVTRHRGGFTPITCDLTGIAEGGQDVTVVVRARDYSQGPLPRGKQSTRYAPYSCLYTRTTGIWQTVWMEPVPKAASLKRTRITPDLAQGAFLLEQPLTQNRPGFKLRATLSDDKGVVVTAGARADLDFAPRLSLIIPEDRQRVWSISDPFLYTLRIELLDDSGTVIDAFDSYAGLRSVSIDGKKVKINGVSVFQRLILDQGYYPDGVLTAPSDEALINDIKISMEAGFNGARLHQKVFEERFLYHADRMGYICWGEFADWGVSGFGPNNDHQQPGATFISQWLEALERDYSHPSIVGWCGLNETWQDWQDRITVLDDVTRGMFLAAKAMDTTRPVLDTSGYAHRVSETDIYDSHDYITDKEFKAGLETFRKRHSPEAVDSGDVYLNPTLPEGTKLTEPRWSVPYKGQPYFVSEFGGFKWNEAMAAKQETKNSWGYGESPSDIEAFYDRFEATCHILMDNPHMFGFCYTQLTDVFPEENGIVSFDRKEKFDMARLRAILERVAAIEE
jgi:beta-galactosidase/beta-glucuronidase